MRRGDLIQTPVGVGRVVRTSPAVVVATDRSGLQYRWRTGEVRPLERPKPDKDAAEAREAAAP